MRVLYVNNQVRLGGAETVVHQLRRGFSPARLIVADGRTFPSQVGTLYPRWLAWLYHSRLHGFVEWLAPRDRWTDRAFRRLADAPVDLIHLHNFHGRYATVESLAYVARRKPLVWTFHALWGVTGGCDHPRDCPRYLEACGKCPQLGRWPLPAQDETAAQLAAKLAHLAPLPLHIIAPSVWLAEIVRQSRVGRNWHIHHIPNSVNAEFSAALEKAGRADRASATPTVLIVNRNFRDEQKGFPILQTALVLAAEALGDSRPRLILVGENAEWARQQLSGWDGEPVGYVTESQTLARLQSAADIFLFASPAENFPCVVLEAMAAGSCVVATPTGGVVEQIVDGVSGILAREVSGPALGQALLRALQDPALRKSTGDAARARAAGEFSEAQFLDRHRLVYAEILDRWRPHP